MTRVLLYALLMIGLPLSARCYSLLSHEAIIDTTWKQSIRPLLLAKYPGSSDQQLKDAYAYVYGGAVVPDIGYYPLGSLTFSHLLHYVRSGDFVNTLINDATSLNEYAFALGLLCHYNADRYGHPLGTNVAVPLLFPEARHDHGDTVTYDEDRKKHIRAEFGFDVLQTAKSNYAPKAYRDFIGFKISEQSLERAFLKTYGLQLDEVFGSLPAAVETFRFSVRHLVPELTEHAWKARKNAITKLNPLADKGSYQYKVNKKEYKKDFGAPTIKSVLLASFIGILPKYGPLSGMRFKEPTPEVEKIYDRSFNAIVEHYEAELKKLKQGEKANLDNIDFDTGRKTARGEYKSADEAHYEWVEKLKKTRFKHANEAIRQTLLNYYSSGTTDRYATKPCRQRKISKALDQMKTAT